MMAIYPVPHPNSAWVPAGIIALLWAKFEIAKKIGDAAPSGAVFKDRLRTGELLRPIRPVGPIITRILWLRDARRKTETHLAGTFTSTQAGGAEYRLPVSYGCIRMRSAILSVSTKSSAGAQK